MEYQSYGLCVESLDYDVPDSCIMGEDTRADIDEISIEVPSGIGRPNDHVSNSQPTYYDDEGNVLTDDGYITPSVYQGDDSKSEITSKDNKEQGAGVTVNIGDESDNNKVTIDQRSTFADVIKDVLPYAAKAGSAVKNTAVEILN